MDFYYELFFDGDEINNFWGTAETVIGYDTYELCAQPYYIHLDDNNLSALEATYDWGDHSEEGIEDNEEMALVLEMFHSPVPGDADSDLINCVYPDTRDCLFAFRAIDEGEYDTAVG